MPSLFDTDSEEKTTKAPSKKKEAYRVVVRKPFVIVERTRDGEMFFYPDWDGKTSRLEIEEPDNKPDVSAIAKRLDSKTFERLIIQAGILSEDDLNPQSIERLSMNIARQIGA